MSCLNFKGLCVSLRGKDCNYKQFISTFMVTEPNLTFIGLIIPIYDFQ
jgi:hypothetical protein